MMSRRIVPRTERVTITVREAHPIASYMASALGALTGRDINGHTGTVRIGYPGADANRSNFKGYASPQQMFLGWNPRRVAGGAIRPTRGSLPSTQAPPPDDNSALLSAVTTIGIGQGQSYG